MPLVFFAFSQVPRLHSASTLDRHFPFGPPLSGPPLDPLRTPFGLCPDRLAMFVPVTNDVLQNAVLLDPLLTPF
eukprot:1195377-Prorocentrum_minimum.AAC.4